MAADILEVAATTAEGISEGAVLVVMCSWERLGESFGVARIGEAAHCCWISEADHLAGLLGDGGKIGRHCWNGRVA